MGQAGNVLIGANGSLIAMDRAFRDIMRITGDTIWERSVLDAVAPADREESAREICCLQETGRPLVMTKRVLRQDGSHVWVKKSLSLVIDRDGATTIIATIEPVMAEDDHEPAILFDTAKALIESRQDRASVCDLSLFSEPGWDILLAVYVAEAEGRCIDVAGIAKGLDVPLNLAERWIKALVRHDMLEFEYRDPLAMVLKAFRLTAKTHKRLESYLSRHRPAEVHASVETGTR